MMNSIKTYCLGIDFGTDSVRCLLINALDGFEVAASVYDYPRWKEGLYCNAGDARFRQHPMDYIQSLEAVVKDVLDKVDPAIRSQICSLSMDTTGSSPAPVDRNGTPLALLPAFKDDPDAMFYLWKDHTAISEAIEINSFVDREKLPYLNYVGGYYSPEWFWSKLLHLLRKESKVAKACYSWVEHADWMPFLLTGGRDVHQLKRGICAAGHKALWSAKWNGFPPDSFWRGIDPLLSGFADRISKDVYTSDQPAGTLSEQWATRLGLSTDVKVGIGALDAHMGAVGGQIEPYYLSKVMGTSTCDMLVAPSVEIGDKLVHGICGQVPGSIIPGMIGMEAGQSAFGDVYAWFRDFLLEPLRLAGLDTRSIEDIKNTLLPRLNEQAMGISTEEWNGLPISLDWFNGRRSPDVNPLLKAATMGMHLGTSAVHIFASLVEATCFGSKAIVERFLKMNIPVKGVIGVGGISHKSAFVMQTLANVLGRPIKISSSHQSGALGAAMFGATLSGIYPDVSSAMMKMGKGFVRVYEPDPAMTTLHNQRYIQYQSLGNYIQLGSAQ